MRKVPLGKNIELQISGSSANIISVTIQLCLFQGQIQNCSKKLFKSIIETYHMWPDGACKLTWDEYWKAGCWSFERIGSWAITPLPLTVSNVPESEKILQFLSRNWTDNSPRFSNRMQYRHCKKIEKRGYKISNSLSFYALVSIVSMNARHG